MGKPHCIVRVGPAIGLGAVVLFAATLLPLDPALGAEAVVRQAGYSVGVFDPSSGAWYVRDPSGHTTRLGVFGGAGDIPLAGDWDGDGVDSPGLYRPAAGRLVVRNGPEPISFIYPIEGEGLPVVADTDGDGKDTVSLARGGRLYILDGLGEGPVSLQGPDPLPIVLPAGTEALVGGDFDGDGVDEVAAVHQGTVDMLGERRRVALGYIGRALPVAGDWDGDGVYSVGGYDAWRAEFRFLAADGEAAPAPLAYGATGMLPVAGDFGELPGRDFPPMHRAGLPPMSQGDEGPEVLLLQTELARHGLYRAELDGVFGPATAYAVVTFHKLLGVKRTWGWEEADSLRMAGFTFPPLPERPQEPNRVEVDVGRQVLYLIEHGEVEAVIPVSTAGSYVYWSERQQAYVGAGTPHGDFTLTRHSVGWVCDPLTGWCIYNPWNFTPTYAIHGYLEVPAYPASHGCVRVPTWEADYLEGHLFVGMPFHVWDEYRPPTR